MKKEIVKSKRVIGNLQDKTNGKGKVVLSIKRMVLNIINKVIITRTTN